MGNFTSTDTLIGNWLAIVASAISISGVICNNVFLQHTLAMQIWVLSNFLFIFFFFGQYMKYWNGGLSSATICISYTIMLVTGLYGLAIV